MSMFDDASYQLLAEATGWNPSSKEWENKGWADVSHQVHYQGELHAGVLAEIEGGITDIGNSSFTARYLMKNKITGQRAAILTAKVVYFDLKVRKSIPLPEELRQQMQICMVKI